MEKETSANEILEKLKWYHGDELETFLLKDEFWEFLEEEQKQKLQK